MNTQSVARDTRQSVKIRYSGSEDWFTAFVVDVWRPEDLEAAQSDDPGSPYTVDLIRGAFLALRARGMHVDTITRLVLNRTPFALFRVSGRLFDCLGKPVEVRNG